MARFQVTAPVGDFTGEVGTGRFVAGRAFLDDEVDAATLAYCRSAGYIVEEPTDDPEVTDPEVTESGAEQPKKSASTEVWRAWAVEHGGMEADEADTLSRDQLVERFTSSTEGTPA